LLCLELQEPHANSSWTLYFSCDLLVSDQEHSREWNSSAYHRLSQPQVSWGQRVLSRLKLRGDERVLDAGCGTGRLTAELIAALPRGRVVGVDLSQNMLVQARDHLHSRQVSLVAADLLQLPFDGAFDGIVSTAAFHWVLDHPRLFAGLHRALRPGGWLQAQCGGGPNLARLRERVSKLAQTAPYAPYLAGFAEPWFFADDKQAAEILRHAGFVNIETSLEAAPTILDDARQYEEFVSNIILRAHLQQIPSEELRTNFITELREQAAQDVPPYSLDYWRLNLSAAVT
jgi:trans-aconitate 2-methyltransferase